MPRRAATVTQADVSRMIRAVRAAGLTVVRVVARPDGISVETSDSPALETAAHEPPRRRPVL